MFGKRQHDEAPGTHYRTDRISTVNGQYFFATREGTLVGPFFTRIDAQQAITRYVGDLDSLAAQQAGQLPHAPRRH
ncbi:hypothetical protein D3C81_1959590 [compost metagenome]|jgi:hypothetical protein|uniref:DUF6316 domain-containing protein n=1 Tax=Pseudomonas linyingensis TaxID=915471 RepID=A0A1H7B4Z8_9PSED|nr:DUF6316 family protein [Pseudomonas linyingensis]MCM2319909.1 DUF6316 family protein [Pseudomonas sp.]SEJ72216.1 hypothetical protein SAMN05216201_11575 [Pseudomonas linyingensis]